jgi:hypothetical protein
MHLITQPVCILSCSNSAMRSNNGANRMLSHDIAAQTITEPPPCFTVGTIFSGLQTSLGVLQTKLCWCKEQCEGQLIWPYHVHVSCFWCTGFMVVTPSFTHLSITFSNQRFSNCSPTTTLDVGFVKFTLDSFCGNRIFEMNIQFCSNVTCAGVIVWFFETIFLNVRWSLSVSIDLCLLMLSSHDRAHWWHNLKNRRSQYLLTMWHFYS